MWLKCYFEQALDSVLGYTGIREFTLQKVTDEAPLRIFLNNQPLLALGLLDQVRSAPWTIASTKPHLV
jgi:hypothetical protein